MKPLSKEINWNNRHQRKSFSYFIICCIFRFFVSIDPAYQEVTLIFCSLNIDLSCFPLSQSHQFPPCFSIPAKFSPFSLHSLSILSPFSFLLSSLHCWIIFWRHSVPCNSMSQPHLQFVWRKREAVSTAPIFTFFFFFHQKKEERNLRHKFLH